MYKTYSVIFLRNSSLSFDDPPSTKTLNGLLVSVLEWILNGWSLW